MSSITFSASGRRIRSQTGLQRRKLINRSMLVLTAVFTLLAIIPLVWIVVYTIGQGLQYLNLDLLTKLPVGLGQLGGGVSHALQGTIVITVLASLFSIPIALLAGVYAASHPNTKLGVGLRFSTDVLAGVPSIIVGLFGYAAIVVPMGTYSALAAGVAVAIIMIPSIVRTTEEMLKLVPQALREGSLALGSPEWKTTVRVLLPAAVAGVVTGFILAIARGVGETAPLLFTALGNDRYDLGTILRGGMYERLILQPTDALTLTMYKYSQSPFPERQQQAWAVALLLMVFVLGVNVFTRWLVLRTASRHQR
jgi:phosphate transport system permease protein